MKYEPFRSQRNRQPFFAGTYLYLSPSSPNRGNAAQNKAWNQLNIDAKRICLAVIFAAWLIGFAKEKNLSTEITEMKVADEIERKMVKNPWNWQNPSLNCHDCCEKVTIENGIAKAVIKNCVDVNPTRNKLLTVRMDVLVRMRQRTATLLKAAITSRIENKTTATTIILRYPRCSRSQRF